MILPHLSQKMLILILFVVSLTATQKCDWTTFFAKSNNRCTSKGSVAVDCSKLKKSEASVKIKCDSGKKLVGYSQYFCHSGNVLPVVSASECVPIDDVGCSVPLGKQADNIKFVEDANHKFAELPRKSQFPQHSYHVQCTEGYSFKDSVKESVVAQCGEDENGKSKFYITTDSAKDGCLPACQVADKNKLPKNVENLDRITIVYPSDKKEVGSGAMLHAKVLCRSGYSPVNVPVGGVVNLSCATKDQQGPYSGYLLQSCDDKRECFQCSNNCVVPRVKGGIVYARDGSLLVTGSSQLPAGKMTAYVKCNDGLDVVGNRHISCDNGEISTAVPSCSGDKVCSPVVVSNGFVLPDMSSTTSTKFQLECSPGYSLAANSRSTVTCTMNENSNEVRYSKLPVCHMGCPALKIKNGALIENKQIPDNVAPYSTNETATVKCDSDYIILGDEAAKCGVEGWKAPQCLTEEQLTLKEKVLSDGNSAHGCTVSIVLISLLLVLTRIS